jgi:hypothetical protein
MVKYACLQELFHCRQVTLEKDGMLAMTINHSLSLALTASVLAVGWVMPAAATELPVHAIHKVANLATPSKPARQGPVRIASAGWLPSADTEPHRPFPIILGVTY